MVFLRRQASQPRPHQNKPENHRQVVLDSVAVLQLLFRHHILGANA
jgi:hypothetical protein